LTFNIVLSTSYLKKNVKIAVSSPSTFSLLRRYFVPIVRHVRNDKTTSSGRREGCLSYVDRRQNWHIRRVRNGSGVWGDVLERFEGARQINIWGICCRMKAAWETHRLFGGSVKGISGDFHSFAYRKCQEPTKIYIDI